MVETFILLFFLLTEVKDGLSIVVVQIYDEDLNDLNTNCRMYYMHFTETEFMNEPDNLSRMLFQLFLMYQIHRMHPLKSKRRQGQL